MMTTRTINLATIPLPKRYVVGDVNLAGRVFHLLNGHVQQWQKAELLEETDSFGLVAAHRNGGRFENIWNNPESLMSFTIGWGPSDRLHIANALRQMRASARTGLDSLLIVEDDPSLFQDIVDEHVNDPKDPYPWGDLPQGGAAFDHSGHDRWLVGVSGFAPAENHWIALTVVEFLDAEYRRLSGF